MCDRDYIGEMQNIEVEELITADETNIQKRIKGIWTLKSSNHSAFSRHLSHNRVEVDILA